MNYEETVEEIRNELCDPCLAVQIKEQLIELAESGADRPDPESRLGIALYLLTTEDE